MVWNVYKHTAPNGKVYIGITSQPCNKRWRNGKGYKHNQHFSSAIKEFGWEDIKHEVLYENIPQEEAQRIEKKLINEYKSDNREFGYNIECGGLLHDTTSEETNFTRMAVIKRLDIIQSFTPFLIAWLFITENSIWKRQQMSVARS